MPIDKREAIEIYGALTVIGILTAVLSAAAWWAW